MFVMACAVLIVKAFRGIPGLDDGKVGVRDSNPGYYTAAIGALTT
jgi:hypothetical protein